VTCVTFPTRWSRPRRRAPGGALDGVYHAGAMSEHTDRLRDLAERIAAAKEFL
jgi:hypothetical protein